MDIGALNNIVSYIPGSCKEAIASEIDILVNAISERDALRAELRKEKSRTSEVLFFCSSDTRLHFFNKWSEEYQAPVPAMLMKSESLSDEEIMDIRNRAKLNDNRQIDPMSFARYIERAVIAKAMPIPKQEPAGVVHNHWAIKNPGIADQFKNEAIACRLALGFKADADDVAPVDLIEKIKSLNVLPDVGDFEMFLVEYHSQVWAAASDEEGRISYDDAGKELAKSFIASIKQSPRITEQDAREIAASVFNVVGLNTGNMVDAWIEGDGNPLLAKLNEKNHE